MELRSVESIVKSLNAAGVRYLIAGGMAVVAHGYLRLTMDLDLILDLNEENLRAAVSALAARLAIAPSRPCRLNNSSMLRPAINGFVNST